jgi:predicted metal-binding membrane protein
MNAVWIVVFGIFAVWGAAAMMLSVADWLVRRRYLEQLETRDWTEKVDAMRRLQDQDGDA